MSLTPQLQKFSVSASYRIMEQLVGRATSSYPVVLVDEFPKSGGTWLARLLSTASGYPFIDNSTFPVLAPAILRTHWTPQERFSPMVYVVRDGREVMVSWFHHRARWNDRAWVQKRYSFLPGGGLDADRIAEQLPAFIDFEFANPGAGVQVNWAEHVERGLVAAERSERAVVVDFSDLRRDAAGTVGSICRDLLDLDLAPDVLDSVVAVNSAAVTKARESIHHHERSFVRQAGAGNWRDDFTEEAQAAFDLHAGPTQKRLDERLL